jgi:fatty aldehyde decarbonylase
MKNTNLRQLAAHGCSTNEQLHVWRDILAQAVTGELVGALNYETLAELCDDATEKAEALDHATSERSHAARFNTAGREMGLNVGSNLDASYWKRIREAFLSRARANDFVGCVIAQEVMLESFAVASYQLVAAKAPGKLGSTFAEIAREEGEHIGHAVEMLQAERAGDLKSFDAKVLGVHEEVMTTLAEMVAREDPAGHCGLCEGNCVKPSLPCVGLSTGELRGASLRRYLQTLDEIGLPGESTLAWIARLPI